MASYTFKWTEPANEVYVTGTFDGWSQSQKLEKVGDVFEKTVALPDSADKIMYKFVVDGNWVTDSSAPKEQDEHGIDNNVLTVEQLVSSAGPAAAIMNTVSPDATTAQLAKDVPKEEAKDAPKEEAKDAPKEEKPAVPGTFPETPASELDKQIKISPLPAADGAVNPVKLQPGEKVPDALAAGDVGSSVRLDKASYDKADALPGVPTDLPPVGKNMIPESSLPIVGADATINTVTPTSTTVALAGKVPLESARVPDVVKESQEKAGVDPEASGVAEEVREKGEVEEELLKKVPEVPSTSEGTAGAGTDKSEKDKTPAETAAKDKVVEQTGAAAPQAAADAAASATAKLPEPAKQALPASVQDTVNGAAKEEKTREEISPEVPAEVKESIQEAGESPEAAANTTAVEEKKEVEAELLKEVKPVEPAAETSATGAPAEVNGAGAASAAAPTKEPETPAKATAAESNPKDSSTKDSLAATTERKKRNRLSQMFSKIKHKISSKD